MTFRSFVLVFLLAVTGLFAADALLDPYIIDRIPQPDGSEIVGIIVPSPPATTLMPVAEITRSAVMLSDVPAMPWAYGCSATSAAMAAGYYDRHGLSNMYTGPTNGGLFPLPSSGSEYWSSSTWPKSGGGTISVYNCPLAATRSGIDGRGILGHVDDYWFGYGYSGNDPIGAGWPGHTQGDCTADYMGTNQDYWNNSDGSTTFYNNTSGSRLHDFSACELYPTRRRDGAHGYRLFLESRGYEVYQNYNQYIDGYVYEGTPISGGFTLAQYQHEIDAGRPVLIQVTGHTMLGVGYDNAGSTIYVHDTWDFSSHSMTWGGSYSGMEHYAVGVFVVEAGSYAAAPFTEDFEDGYANGDWRLHLTNDTYSVNDIKATAVHSGNYGLAMYGPSTGYSYSTGSGTLPEMWAYAQAGGDNEDFSRYADVKLDLSLLSAPELDFWYDMGYSYANYYNNFWVLIEDGSRGWTELFSRQTSGATTGWTEQSIDLSAWAGQQVRLRFFHNGKYNNNFLYLDDIAVQEGATVPTLSATTTPYAVLYHRAESGGTITSDGGSAIIGHGLCWVQAPDTPDVTDAHVYEASSATGSFNLTMLPLLAGTTYNVRAYATNGVGTAYGATVQFTTDSQPAEGTGTADVGDGDVNVPNTSTSFYFSGVAGAGGSDITVDDMSAAPESPGEAFLAAPNHGDFSVVVTNNTGFTFTNAELRFNVEQLDALSGDGINQETFLTLSDGDPSGLYLWRRADYGFGDFALLGELLYDSNNGTNGDSDDYLYYIVSSFSEFAFSSTGDHSLPVTLSSFSAVVTSQGDVSLTWVTQSETDLAGYRMFRGTQEFADAMLLTPDMIPATNELQAHSYTFTDVEAQAQATYRYWLESMELDGGTNLYGPVTVTVIPTTPGDTAPQPGLVTALHGAFPNPFNPSATVAYTLAAESNVRLSVYNMRGQRVCVLQNGRREAGEHRAVWNGRDGSGSEVGSGVYFFLLQTDGQTFLQKAILVK